MRPRSNKASQGKAQAVESTSSPVALFEMGCQNRSSKSARQTRFCKSPSLVCTPILVGLVLSLTSASLETSTIRQESSLSQGLTEADLTSKAGNAWSRSLQSDPKEASLINKGLLVTTGGTQSNGSVFQGELELAEHVHRRSLGTSRQASDWSVKIGMGLGQGSEWSQMQLPRRGEPGLSAVGGTLKPGSLVVPDFEPCGKEYMDYTPCEDPDRSKKFPSTDMQHRERHCPGAEEQMKCLIPPPVAYRFPQPWPTSRDEAWFANVPYKHLTQAKADQNWIVYDSQAEKFHFPGGGTMFHDGADKYIASLAKLIPLNRSGVIRTALDTGCGVGSFGAFMLDHGVLTMSIAPRDGHEAQVQFALERGIPAMLAVLSTKRLPYPSRAFDLVHCSRCLIPWAGRGGKSLVEVDRVLRPGGFWVLTGPPIGWRRFAAGWKKEKKKLRLDQEKLEAVAKSLCWEKYVEKDMFAVWRKPMSASSSRCLKRKSKHPKDTGPPPICPRDQNPDFAWYTPLSSCISRQPVPPKRLTALERAEEIELPRAMHVASISLLPWPRRLWAVPPRVTARAVPGLTPELLERDTHEWKWRLQQYKTRLVPILAAGERKGGGLEGEEEDQGIPDDERWHSARSGTSSTSRSGAVQYRNVLDMNAGAGGFAAALHSDPFWVMNVIPVETEDLEKDTAKLADSRRGKELARNLSQEVVAERRLAGELLGVIYERGLIGTFHDWCEAFSTYPRTYDLLHAANLFTRWRDRRHPCPLTQVLLEMDRILRPEGAVIIQDEATILQQIVPLAKAMRWDARYETLESSSQSEVVSTHKGRIIRRRVREGEADSVEGTGHRRFKDDPKLVLVCVKKYWTAG